jgi:C-terminal processing protease CtpA/Prc
MDTVFTIDNTKIGYVFYTFFQSGPEDTNLYDQEMDAVFADFKAEGVTEFVLDLRYNNGGGIAPTTNLASLIAPDVSTTDIFYENQWNEFYMEYFNSLPNGDDILRGKFYEKAENIGVNTVYVLVTGQSASASELMINGLLPYMNVEIIGTTTSGKNVGSVPIEDEDDPDNTYGMLPIVLKVFNAAGQSDYDNGFTPAGANFIDETQFAWYPLGDIRDPLLSRAIEQITGTLPGTINNELREFSVPSVSREIISRDTKEALPLIFDNPLR